MLDLTDYHLWENVDSYVAPMIVLNLKNGSVHEVKLLDNGTYGIRIASPQWTKGQSMFFGWEEILSIAPLFDN